MHGLKISDNLSCILVWALISHKKMTVVITDNHFFVSLLKLVNDRICEIRYCYYSVPANALDYVPNFVYKKRRTVKLCK